MFYFYLFEVDLPVETELTRNTSEAKNEPSKMKINESGMFIYNSKSLMTQMSSKRLFKDEINLITHLLKYPQTPNIYKEYIAKFQINNCFENYTHEPIIFAHYLNNLPNIFII